MPVPLTDWKNEEQMGLDEITIRCVHCNDELEVRMVLVDLEGRMVRVRLMHVGEKDTELKGPNSGRKKKERGNCIGMMDHEVLDVYGEEIVREGMRRFARRLMEGDGEVVHGGTGKVKE